ncbi:ATP phosphoribosyltransferase regulatory subunit [Jannaschia sp. W003]|uniref:ATP phosphoribosyltransferase regulatory subunit n=1 Tax=Jannaschia sp. W003 TaxID=2867012 RepID=UPI0021A36541|nr:ATP phosphoribosyltransferase regulatory subunit [Jannaschia sp. W003]UWQ22267.1 ATP phosphoribosyltransferase regulatory subunit [Jannaschia sp. W003]
MIAAADRARASRFLARFEAAGAARVEPPILLDAGPLLDLYGEDLRARAFTTFDPLRGEAVLRPDFTVPLVRAHMDAGGGAARLAYAGEVFRRQEADAARPREYLQAGIEFLGGDDPADADAEAFALFAEALAPWGATGATGDLGLLRAAVATLRTTERRRAALLRHIPRPRRFRVLMERFQGRAASRPAPTGEDAPHVGLRTAQEIAARHAALAEDAATPPVSAVEAGALEALLDLELPMAAALEALRDLEVDLPGLGPAVDRMDRRAEALSARGADVGTLPFAARAGRGAMEYYDGFTFTFAAPGGGGPTVATGGRYDALAAALGAPAGFGAVGGVVRPGLLPDPAEDRP